MLIWTWLKRYWPALILCGLLIALLDGVISSLLTCHPIAEKSSHGAKAQEAKEYRTALNGPILISIRWIAHIAHKYEGLITAAFTIVLAVFTGTLWRSTDKLAAISINTASAQERDTRVLQRAYLAVEPLGINPFLSEGVAPRQIVGHVAIVNVGRLPARNVSFQQAQIKWCANERLEEKDLPITATITPQKTVLPPGTKMRLGTHSIAVECLERDGSIYVWGKVEYIDGFDIPRYTRFCHRYPTRMHEQGHDGERIKAEHARYHQHGNDAD
jgi:hypothetical protein